MSAVEWVLIILLIVPAVLVCWALFKSGALQTSATRLRALQPATRRRVWTAVLVFTLVGISLGAAVVWAFATSHAVLGLAVLVGFVVLNGIVTPFLRARSTRRKSAPGSRAANTSR